MANTHDMNENMTDKAACERFERCLDGYLGDALASREREAVRRHVSSCPACLARLTGDDPLAVFLPLSQETPSARLTDGFWDAVRAGIELESAGVRKTPEIARPGALAAFGRRRLAAVAQRRLVAVALAASLLVMVLAAWLAGRVTPIAVSGRSPVVAERARPAAAPRAPAARSDAPLPQTVEQVRTEDARDVQVYSMTWLDRDPSAPGRDPGQVTELILIVDAGLKL